MARTWAEMRASTAERLLSQTGHDVTWWNEKIAAQDGLGDEASLRALLAGDGRNTAGGSVNLRIALSCVDDLDDEAIALFRRAYQGEYIPAIAED